MNPFYHPRAFLSEHKQEAIRKLISETIPDRDFYLLAVGAVLLAVSGILLDSIPVLIASMIVAPLASPILLLALGAAVRDMHLMKRSIAMLFGASIAALAIAVVASTIAIRFSGVTPERVMISFSPNYFFDSAIALVSGFIAAYGLMRTKVGAAMTGIGIAVSLMPPLVASGIEIAALNIALARDALIIFLLNVFGILIASAIVFVAFGFRGEYKKIKV